LAYLAQSVNEGYSYSGEYIKLTADIVLNDIYFEFLHCCTFPRKA
jgi:hypothetical protein